MATVIYKITETIAKIQTVNCPFLWKNKFIIFNNFKQLMKHKNLYIYILFEMLHQNALEDSSDMYMYS